LATKRIRTPEQLARKKVYDTQWKLANRERINAQIRERRAANREEHNRRAREYQWANKEKIEARRVTKLYGLSSDAFSELKIRQGNKCAICSNTAPLVVDHNHKTGRVRALLCQLCNRGLGHFRDSPELLGNAAGYLNRHG
jgi:hypothetical protein